MEKVQHGDVSKMGLLYERHHKDLFAYFYRCTQDQGKSEDLVQNLFIRMLKYSKTFAGKGEFVYWMYSSARNLWYDTNRKKDPLAKGKDLNSIAERSDMSLDSHQHLEREERKSALWRALNQLVPEQKEAIVLSRFQELKYREIAVITNCSENTVKSRIKRGLVELKELMKNELI